MVKVLKSAGLASRIISNFLTISLGFLVISLGVMLLVFHAELQKQAEAQVASQLSEVPDIIKETLPEPTVVISSKDPIWKLFIVGGITVVASLFSLGLSHLFCCLKLPVSLLFVAALAAGYTALMVWIQTKSSAFLSWVKEYNVSYHITLVELQIDQEQVVLDVHEYAVKYFNYIKLAGWIMVGALILATIITFLEVGRCTWTCLKDRKKKKDSEEDGEDDCNEDGEEGEGDNLSRIRTNNNRRRNQFNNSNGTSSRCTRDYNDDFDHDDDANYDDNDDYDIETNNNRFNNGGALPKSSSAGSYRGVSFANKHRSSRPSSIAGSHRSTGSGGRSMRSSFQSARGSNRSNGNGNNNNNSRNSNNKMDDDRPPSFSQNNSFADSNEVYQDSEGNQHDARATEN